MKTTLCFAMLALVALMSGCSTTKLGTMLYVPHGQSATLSVAPPAAAPAPAASAAK